MKLHFQAYLLGRSMFSWSICFKKKRERKEKKLVLLRPICPCLQPQPGFVLHTHSVGAETDLNLCFTFDLQYLCINRYLERHGSRILSLCTFLFENCRGTWTQTGIWGHSTTRQLFFCVCTVWLMNMEEWLQNHMYDYFHVRILLLFLLKRHQVFVPNLQYVLKCCLNRWKQGWKSIFFKGMKISHKQLTWVFLFLKYFLLQFHLGVETVWAVQKLLHHQIEPWSLWVLMSKHRKWSACLFMTYKLTCCFCL